MIDLILPEARLRHAGALMQMHRDRKRVFVDMLGWSLPSGDSWLEVDEYDNDFAVYLLLPDSQGRHLASVRILPTTRPHMLSQVFPSLCEGPVPAGEDCWEISRLVTSPNACSGLSVVRLHRLLALALAEFACLNGVRRYTLVAEANRVPVLLSVGWPVLPIGLPTLYEREELQALQISVDSTILHQMRRRLRLGRPVLRVDRSLSEAA